MAGDWLKLEINTPDKPEVIGMADMLGILPQHVLGSLFMVWRWFDQHTTEGNASYVTKVTVDRLSGVTGFADAMQKVGWLIVTDGHISLPNFDRHNGETAKQRGLTAKRVAKSKAKSNARGNDEVTEEALPREEKSREKNLIKPIGLITPSSVIEPEPLKNKTTALVKTTVGESESELQSACRETWNAYGAAYANRYGAAPVRNAPINSQIKQFVQRIGAAESPQVAAFYVTNNAAFYVKQMHSVGMLLKDAEKLRTEWATNRRVTDTEARQADKTQAIGGVFQELIEEARERRATAA